MGGLMFGFCISAFAVAFLFLGVYAANDSYADKAKKDDCEQALILREHECKPYYLTTEEIKLIERLGEK